MSQKPYVPTHKWHAFANICFSRVGKHVPTIIGRMHTILRFVNNIYLVHIPHASVDQHAADNAFYIKNVRLLSGAVAST